MINRFLLTTAKRIRPELSMMSGLDLIGSMIDMAALIYMLPFALAGFIWLVVESDLDLIIANWPLFIIMLVASWIFLRLDFTLRLEIRPGIFSVAGGSFETLIFWSGILMFGPTALWLSVIIAIINFKWQQLVGGSLRWYRWRKLSIDIATITLAGLLANLAYNLLGGEHPFPGIMTPSIVPVIGATLIWFVFPRLLVLPVLMYASRSPELVGTGSLTDQAKMTRFLLLGTSISGFADPFAVLAAGLYAQQSIVDYLFFIGGALLATLLANRLSRSVTTSEQRTREMAVLEQLSRAIMTAPADRSVLPDILADHVNSMFPHSRLEIRLFPDEVLLRHPDNLEVDSAIWERLQNEAAPYLLLPNQRSTRTNGVLTWDSLVVGITRNSDDEIIGGLYLLTQRDNGRINDFLPAAHSLAAQVGSAIQRVELHDKALEEQAEIYQKEVYAQAYQAEMYAQVLALEKMTHELEVAGQIQASFLPEELPEVPGWQLAVTLEPAREASGDFYDFINLPDGRLGLVVADVAEKGVGAALYMALSRTLIRTFATDYDLDPEKALEAANRRIFADTNSDLFVTVFYAVLDPATGILTYCNAGHNPPLLLQSQNGNQTLPLTRTALPLGIFEDATWDKSEIQIMPGDVLMLYTDGVTEAQNEEDDFFGEDRLQKILRANARRSAEMIEDKIISAVYDFTGDEEQYDDITLMVVVREP